MLWGLYTLGFAREANDFLYCIADVAAGKKDLQIMYGIGGEHELTEKTLDYLADTRLRSRSGSATARTTSSSTTCGARCSTRCTCTPSRATTCRRSCGRS